MIGIKNNLSVPKTRLRSAVDKAFSVTAAKAWNDLPPSVQSALTVETFKERLKTCLFTRVYM